MGKWAPGASAELAGAHGGAIRTVLRAQILPIVDPHRSHIPPPTPRPENIRRLETTERLVFWRRGPKGENRMSQIGETPRKGTFKDVMLSCCCSAGRRKVPWVLTSACCFYLPVVHFPHPGIPLPGKSQPLRNRRNSRYRANGGGRHADGITPRKSALQMFRILALLPSSLCQPENAETPPNRPLPFRTAAPRPGGAGWDIEAKSSGPALQFGRSRRAKIPPVWFDSPPYCL